MKKNLIVAIVGGILIFLWQFLSFAALDLHRSAQQYTPKQDTILNVLSQNLQEGRYFMPTLPEGASSEEMEKLSNSMNGKPWAFVEYHARWNGDDMAMNMIRGLLVNIIIVYLLVWILNRGGIQDFTTIFLASIFTGLIAFLNFPYTYYIWYQGPGIWADLRDAFVEWGLVGAWLGWRLKK